MFARQLAVARPLVQKARIIPLSSTPVRSFIIGHDRKPIKEPLDPDFYPVNDDTTDPGMVGVARRLLLLDTPADGARTERRICQPCA